MNYSVSKKYYQLFMTKYLPVSIIILCLFIYLFIRLKWSFWSELLIFLIVFTVIDLMINILWYRKAYMKNYHIEVNYNGICIETGVFVRKGLFLPRNNILFVNISQGPISRKFDCSNLIIGLIGNDFSIQGLDSDDARQLRRALLKHVNQNKEEYNAADI